MKEAGKIEWEAKILAARGERLNTGEIVHKLVGEAHAALSEEVLATEPVSPRVSLALTKVSTVLDALNIAD